MTCKLIEIKTVTGQIEVITGLRIGASQDTMEISGMDNPIIRNPTNEEPYIPGSSIKGKMRHLVEWYYGKLDMQRGGPFSENDMDRALQCPITRVFGAPASNHLKIGPTRLVVRDAFLSENDRQRFTDKGKPITEVKHENSINRLTAMANPRPMERVVPGVCFDFSLAYRVIDMDDDGKTDRKFFDDAVLTGLALLQADCLGSAGSRGCGQIKFINLKDNTGQEITLPELKDATARSA